MVFIDLSGASEHGMNQEKKDFYKPVATAWSIIAFDHLASPGEVTQTAAGLRLGRELERGRSHVVLNEQQARILDALADFAAIPHRSGQRELDIPEQHRGFFDRLRQQDTSPSK